MKNQGNIRESDFPDLADILSYQIYCCILYLLSLYDEVAHKQRFEVLCSDFHAN